MPEGYITSDGVSVPSGGYVWIGRYFWPARPEKVERRRIILKQGVFQLEFWLGVKTDEVWSTSQLARAALIKNLTTANKRLAAEVKLNERHIERLVKMNAECG